MNNTDNNDIKGNEGKRYVLGLENPRSVKIRRKVEDIEEIARLGRKCSDPWELPDDFD